MVVKECAFFEDEDHGGWLHFPEKLVCKYRNQFSEVLSSGQNLFNITSSSCDPEMVVKALTIPFVYSAGLNVILTPIIIKEPL